MNSIKNILLSHASLYPKMLPADAVKLIYQATFGGGHMVLDEASVIARTKNEYDQMGHKSRHLKCEVLGEASRIYIDSPMSDSQIEIIAKIFINSARGFSKGYTEADGHTRELFEARLRVLESLCREGAFAFTHTELEAYLEEYRKSGYPAVSHSDVYRKNYTPAYRVIDSRYVRLLPVIFKIAERLHDDKHTVLAIEGRAASGKTTAAALISELFPAQTVRMDDFFLPPRLRTQERLCEAGGNVHRERFVDEVLWNLRSQAEFSYRVFDCSQQDYKEKPRRILPAPLYIVEGSYSMHPAFGKYYDISFFSDVTAEEQEERILRRNGENMLERFRREWIPMEEKYFSSIGKGR